MGRLRAVVLCDGDIRDVRSWAGIPFFISRALDQEFGTVATVSEPWPRWYRPVGRMLKLLRLRRYEYTRSLPYTWLATRRVVREVARIAPDVVVTVSASPLAYGLAARWPVVHCADATPRALYELDGGYDPIAPAAMRSADRMDRAVLSRAVFSVFASDWARNSALVDYGADPDRTFAIPFGANIDQTQAVPRTGGGTLRLLFVGRDWMRKGGPLAIAVAEELYRRGQSVQLDIVGNAREAAPDAPHFVRFHGELHKDVPENKATFDALYEQATLFLLPTQAECYGIVFAEAAHAALPVVSFAVGGVTTVVRDGETGILLPLGSGASAFVDAIIGLISSPARYEAMSAAALADAKARLNWAVWGERVATLIRERLAAHHLSPSRAILSSEAK